MTIDELVSKISVQVDAAPLAALQQRFKAAATAIQHSFGHGAEGSVDHLGEKIEGVSRRLEFLGAVEVVKGLAELVERFGTFAEELNASAQAAGIGVEALQGLQYAAAGAAVSSETVNTSLAHLTRTLYEARNGSAEAVDTFAKIGISRGQVMGFKDGQQALEAFADRIAGMTDPIEKEALALKVLGRGGGQTIAWLSKGSKGMRAAAKEAEELGAIISGPQVHALQEAEDAGHTLIQVFHSIAGTIAATLAPSFVDGVHAVLNFYKAHRLLITTNLNKWANSIAYAMGYVFGIMRAVVGRFLEFAAAHETLVTEGIKWTSIIYGIAIAVSVLGFGIGLLAAPIKNLIALMGVVQSVGSVSFSAMMVPLSMLRRGIAKLLLQLALMTATAFPGLSAAALSAAAAIEASWAAALWPVAALVAAFAAGYAIGHDLNILLTGGSLKDTWLGQAIDYVTELTKKVGAFLGLVNDTPETPKYGDNAQVGSQQPGPGAVPKSLVMPATYDEQAEMAIAANQKAITDRMAAVQGRMGQDPGGQIMSDPVRLAVAAKQQQDTAAKGQPPSNVEITSPITINAAAGTSAADLEKIAKRVVDQQMQTAMREAQRSTRPTVHY